MSSADGALTVTLPLDTRPCGCAALQKSDGDKTKTFAQKMIDDHTATLAQKMERLA